jgi:hypothetical protein
LGKSLRKASTVICKIKRGVAFVFERGVVACTCVATAAVAAVEDFSGEHADNAIPDTIVDTIQSETA